MGEGERGVTYGDDGESTSRHCEMCVFGLGYGGREEGLKDVGYLRRKALGQRASVLSPPCFSL